MVATGAAAQAFYVLVFLDCSGLWMLVVCDLLLMAVSSMFLANIRTVRLNTKLTVLLIMVLPMVPISF